MSGEIKLSFSGNRLFIEVYKKPFKNREMDYYETGY